METHFPPKPPLPKEAKPSVNRSLMSLLLFVIIFYLIFGQDLRFLIVMTGVLAIHELGHFIFMQRKGFNDSQLFFLPFLSGYLEGEKTEIATKDRIQVIFAGPVPGIVLGLGLFFAAKQMAVPDLMLPAQVFLFLNLFNLLPFNPLDGGRLLDVAYPDQAPTVQIVAMIIVACLLAIFALIGNPFLLIVPLFLALAVNGRMRIDRIRRKLKENGINLKQSYKELSNEAYGKIRTQLIEDIPLFKNNLDAQQYEVGSPLEMRMQAQIRFLLQPQAKEDGGLDESERKGLLFLWILLFIGPMILAALWTDPSSLNP